MSYYIAAAVTVGTLYQVDENRKAEDRAKKDAKQAETEARKAEVFAETEGEGQGMVGKVRLGVDEQVNTRMGSSLRL